MQEETTNPVEGLSEGELQRITGGCGACQPDQAILEDAHSKIQAYRSGDRQVLSGGQFHAVRNEGLAAIVSLVDRHYSLSPTDLSRSRDLLRHHPDDPPHGRLSHVVDPKASSNVERG